MGTGPHTTIIACLPSPDSKEASEFTPALILGPRPQPKSSDPAPEIAPVTRVSCTPSLDLPTLPDCKEAGVLPRCRFLALGLNPQLWITRQNKLLWLWISTIQRLCFILSHLLIRLHMPPQHMLQLHQVLSCPRLAPLLLRRPPLRGCSPCIPYRMISTNFSTTSSSHLLESSLLT